MLINIKVKNNIINNSFKRTSVPLNINSKNLLLLLQI